MTPDHQAQEQAERFAQMVESSTEAALSVDRDGVLLTWNAAAVDLFGYEVDDIVGQSLVVLVPEELREAADLLRTLLTEGVAQSGETRARCRDGTVADVNFTALPLRNDAGEIVGLAAMARDITEEKAARRRQAETHSRYLGVLEATSEGIWRIDRDGLIDYVNPAVAKMLGYAAEEMIGRPLWDFVPGDQRQHARQVIGQQAQARRGTRLEWAYPRKDGSICWTLMSLIPLFDDAGDGAGTLALLTDITESRAAELERARLASIVESSPDAIISLSTAGVIETWNPGATALYGYSAEEAIGQYAPSFLARDPKERVALLAESVAGAGAVHVVTQDVHKDGRIIDVATTGSSIRDSEGRVVGVARMSRDITERKRMQSQLQRVADYDPLTGVYNRDRLLSDLDRQLRYADRYHRGGVLLALDLDNFAVANDTYGHAAGDAMLRAVAQLLQTRTRETDVVARLGGDEFAILLPEGSEYDALCLASDLRLQLCDREIGPPILASIGIASFRGQQGMSSDEVLTCAGAALHQARDHGGDQARVYTSQTVGWRSWAQRIRAALDEDRFVLYGQPIIEISSGKVARHELLIRMLSEDGEIILPDEFLPAAERFGFIREIDLWVTTNGLRLALDGHPVTINLSAHSIGQQPVLAALRAAIAEGLDPSSIILEITETAAMTKMAAAQGFAGQLNGMGFALAIDDFGTGFGSFTYLEHLPASYIKIDTDFVCDLLRNRDDQELIKGIVSIAHGLDKLTIAEGVEDAETLALLAQLGVDYAQGYHLGRPEPFAQSGPGAGTRMGSPISQVRPSGNAPLVP